MTVKRPARLFNLFAERVVDSRPQVVEPSDGVYMVANPDGSVDIRWTLDVESGSASLKIKAPNDLPRTIRVSQGDTVEFAYKLKLSKG